MTDEWVAVELDDDDIAEALTAEEAEEALRFWRGARNGIVLSFAFWTAVIAGGVALWVVVTR